MNLVDPQRTETAVEERALYRLYLLLVFLSVAFAVHTGVCVFSSGIDSDEVEHAHITWSVSEGIMPYRDVRQNHMPMIWAVFSPMMVVLPHSVAMLIVFRVICLIAITGTYVVGLLVLRELRGHIGFLDGLLLLVLILAVLVDCECYRFRPDPFMVLFTSIAVLAAVRMGRSPVKYSVLCGFALGVAATFSPKMAPLCLLIPVLCVWECIRQRTLRPIWLVIPNGVGFLLGIVPMLAWVSFHGLIESFWRSAVEDNTHLLNCGFQRMLVPLRQVGLFSALAFVSCWSCLKAASRTENTSWRPVNGVVAAAILAWLIVVLEPNHLTYNLQAFIMPAAVISTYGISRLLESQSKPQWKRVAAVGVILVIVSAGPICDMFGTPTQGIKIEQSEMQQLMDLVQRGDMTCIGFTPFHPVFCRDATELHNHWDIAMLKKKWGSEKIFRKRWVQAVSAVERGEPDLVLCPDYWDAARRYNGIDQEQYIRLWQAISKQYHSLQIGDVVVYLRNSRIPTDAVRVGDDKE